MKQVMTPGLFWGVIVYSLYPWGCHSIWTRETSKYFHCDKKIKAFCELHTVVTTSFISFFIISHNLLRLISYKSPMQSPAGWEASGALAPCAGLTASKSLDHGQGPSDRVQRADVWHEPRTCVFTVVLPYKS